MTQIYSKMWLTLKVLLVANLHSTYIAKTSAAVPQREIQRSVGVDCTSENEVCLPANYSRFQLPNKGKQTIVSIGKILLHSSMGFFLIANFLLKSTETNWYLKPFYPNSFPKY